MGFNYAREKREFIKEWERLRAEYEAAGMSEDSIAALHAFDWEWFCSRRSFDNHIQELPVERIDEDDEKQSALVNKFESMRTVFDESAFDSRFAWVETIADKRLADKLKRLSLEDLELLTLLVDDEYSQAEIARMRGCSKNAISKKVLRIKKSLK